MRLRVLTLPVCAALLLSACGGSSTDGSATAATASESASADTAASSEPDSSSSPASDTASSEVSTAAAELDTPEPGGTSATDDVASDPAERGKPAVNVPTVAPTELVVTDLIEGSGTAAEELSTVTFKYVLVLDSDGTEIANNYESGDPIVTQIGVGNMIPGVDEGLVGVKPGGRRQLDIPADLAYGADGTGPIPPDAALTFVIDVLDVSPPPPPPTVPEQADPADCPAVDGSAPATTEFDEYPPFCIDVDASYSAIVVTNKGDFTIELDAKKAPLTVNSFVVLARYHYYDGLSCHRIIPSFVAQCGDPKGDGTGGPGYEFADELPAAGEYEIGSLAMANSGPDTNGSQFFVITGIDGAALPPNYSLFGQVTDGLDTTLPALDAVGNEEGNGVPPLEPVTIESITIEETPAG